LYYYFSGHDDLVGFLLARHVTAAGEVMAAAASEAAGPAGRLRRAVAALAAFLGERPGVCAGLLTFAGAPGQLDSVLAAKDTVLVGLLEKILAEGATSGELAPAEPADAANAILGAIMIATLGRWSRGADSTSPAFQEALADQVVRGVRPA
jgi:AcrR family transcriptional regulator